MIVITAPTGALGHQVLENVLASGEAVRVIVRDPSRLPANVRERVEIVEGSHSEAEVVNQAFVGADAVFWLPPPNPHGPSLEANYVDFTRPACDAIKSQGVQHVVGISALGRGTQWADNAGFATVSLAMDDLLASTGAAYRALTMPSFMDNILFQIEPIKSQGLFFSPIDGDKSAPTCATRDIASAASKLLLDRSWSGQGEQAVLGPEDLSFNDMARIMSEALGKDVRFQQIPFEAFEAQLRKSGMSDAFVQGYVEMMAAKNNSTDTSGPKVA